MTLFRYAGLLAFAGVLASCEREFILPGERFDIRAPFDETAGSVPVNQAAPIALPAQSANASWTHRLGSSEGRLAHPALGASLQPVWSVDIGEGDGRRHRITAEPVVVNGVVYTLDSQAMVTATSAAGQVLWQRDITPTYARVGDASGGGLAFGGGRLYVTSAFGLLVALDPASGAEIWAHRFDAPVKGAPNVEGAHVFVVAADSSAWALEAATGKVDWQLPGTPSRSSMVGGATPALSGGTVILPFASGELIAASRDGGAQLWTTIVAGQRIGSASGQIRDITGDPVVAGGRVYVGNQSGRVMALDSGTGTRVWTAREAAYGPVWPVGGSVFMMSDRNRLIRLDDATGDVVWAVELPLYTEQRERRRAEIFAHYGPVLAGGRLLVASNDGQLRSFDPASGALVGAVEVPGGAASTPVVAGGTAYVISTDGRLHALR
ncbi:PQQ-like beta-propeller repeat protein [Roseicitreum antarcticum]|uniref:Outer membrane protein assembly factor BamB, contains PQQ-like beta-propeller repeat n=1 Tax=Roseicitreum antarcticum TaxID=564137 RepID=A0A1H2W811_9RHOB|nr:PQQ-like beta-propeller repeat protein [Roseicitreum antarcticum]SDW76782.1 Outer membrane protein assembly factor BamB, contains PQQ-like beta-propeller repeat [Roseicitreum antarcticum]